MPPLPISARDGVRRFAVLVLLAGLAPAVLAQTLGVHREVWTNLHPAVTNSLAALTNTVNNPGWPSSPASGFTTILTNFETAASGLTNLGQRFRAYLVPPASGTFTFFVAADDTAQLSLSTNESPTNAVAIAWVTNATGQRVWNAQTNQQSVGVVLEAWRRYYVEARMQQGPGTDHFAVRWQHPSGVIEEPISTTGSLDTLVFPYNGIDTAPTFYRQPTNAIITERTNASFALVMTNATRIYYRWRLNGANISGATHPTYTISNALPPQNGSLYSCVVSNPAGTLTSAVVVLTVLADTNRPEALRAFSTSPTNVQIEFSEPLQPATATNTLNYTFPSNAVAVTRATYAAGSTSVVLTTSPLVTGSNHWLRLNGLRDLAWASNTITTNTLLTFVASPWVLAEVGNPAATSYYAAATGGVNLIVTGGSIGGTNDQLGFGWQLRTGDFDVSIRLASLTLSDTWTKAGLMARETLDPGSRFAAAMATPSLNGDFFEWRDTANAVARKAGAFPANFPDTWLRLKRAGTNFSGYASYDGSLWTLLSTVNLTFSNQLYVGLAAATRGTNRTATAEFRETIENTGSVAVVANTNPREQIGPSSRKSPIVFSEILYKPAPRADSNNVEFVELYNSNPWFHDIGGYRIASAGMSYTFPPGTQIAGGAYLVVAASPAALSSVYGVTNAFGPYVGSLKAKDTLRLHDEQGSELLVMEYANTRPWPVGADETGHSLVLVNPTHGETDPRAWDISSRIGGSPGTLNPYQPDPLDDIRINEFLAHTDPPLEDYIELYNHGNTARDLSGAWLSNSATTNKYRIPNGTLIPARGFVVFPDSVLGFRLDTMGDQIYLVNSNRTRVLDAIDFAGQENPVACGRIPDGGREFHRLAARTPGTNNGAIRLPPVVINEIMYHPISGSDDEQYVEVHNRSGGPVDLGGWQFTAGISFTFPTNTTLAAGGYLVVAKNAALLRTRHGHLNFANCLGDFGGTLSGSGERIALAFPDETINTNTGVAVTNRFLVPVAEVTYGTGGRWGLWSDGGGSSLELRDPDADMRLAPNWADSDETGKAPWTTIEYTGVLDHGANYGSSITNAQVGIMDVGECLMDDFEILAGTNLQNLVLNAGFESGLTNWFMEGSHIRSSLENEGHGGSSRSLHIRSSSRVWTGANSCEFVLQTNGLVSGSTATLRYKARWLRGWPEVYLRLCGNWLEATGPLTLPSNLGTPGLQNSRYATNAPPAIHGVTHGPGAPAATQAVVVTAYVHDPDSATNVLLKYRIDPSATVTAVTMKDDGTGGDTIAFDGVFSGTIPGQASNVVVAFTITATDGLGAASRFPELRAINEPDRECVVLFGDGQPVGSFGVYRLWMTQATINRWGSIPDLSNESHDCTMVNGNRVIYNMVGRFAGSPYHQSFNTPNGALCHYKWTFPEDDDFLGATSFNKIHQPGNGAGDDASLQREQTAHTFLRALRVPWLYKRFMVVYVNGNRRGTLMEDTQTPDADVIDQWWPDDKDGWLYKMQPWFEFPPAFTNSASARNNSWCMLNNHFTAGGVRKTARYRWNYMVRNTPWSANDYTNVFALIDAAHSPSNAFARNMAGVADMENWMRVFAANHAAGNWDSFGANNEQNLYGYVGQNGTRYSLLMWDFNIVIGAAANPWAPGSNLFTYNGGDPNMDRIYRNPEFRRMYWRALLELVAGPLNPPQFNPLLDAKYDAFVANGLSVQSPDLVSSNGIKIWMATAQTSIAAQASAANTTNFSVQPTVVLSNNIALISGSAPFNVKTIWFNGTEWPIEWTTPTGWTARVLVPPGTSVLSVAGVDIRGQVMTNNTGTVTVVYSGSPPSPVGRVVFHEIMYRADASGGPYVELLNTSGTAGFDLSGWWINGLGYTFPAGTYMGPNALLTLAADRRAFSATHGATNPPFDVFSGSLDPDGETLSLLAPLGGQTVVVSRVRYEAGPPWPVFTNAASLQLIDPTNDISRASNWDAGGPGPAPEWTYYCATSIAYNSSNFVMFIGGGPGDLYIDDLRFSIGTQDTGTSLIAHGDFESPLAGTWSLTANFTNSTLATHVAHSGTSCLHVVATAAGSGWGNAIWQPLASLVSNFPYITVSLWYLPTTNAQSFVARPDPILLPKTLVPSANFPASTLAATPNATNSVWKRQPLYPQLWLNEVSPSNTSVIADNAGEREPWVELRHVGTGTLSLAGLYLSDNYTNLTQWAFPTNATLATSSFRVVWCDAQTNQAATNAWHANFRLPPGSGRVALSRIADGTPQVVDYLTYTNVPVNWSYGDIPDGQPFYRTLMYLATPAATNNGAAPAATVSINEWLADNLNGITNPVGGQRDDWIELFNWGAVDVDLGGFHLTDNLADPGKWTFPSNAVVPAGGFLLVWADDQSHANNQGRGVHASFKLSKSGEQIGLYSPSLAPVDTLGFGAQLTDITQGRWPDADANIFTLAVPTPGSNNIVSLLNAAPFFTNATVSVADEMAPALLDGSARDNDAPAQSIRYALLAAPAGASLDTNTGAIVWLPGESDGPSTNEFVVTATDNGWPHLTTTQSLFLIVQEVNRAPQVLPANAVETFAGSITTVHVPATDPDVPANALRYSLEAGAPAGARIDTNLGAVTWMPTEFDAGYPVAIPVLVTDNGVPPLSSTGLAVFNVASPGSVLALGVNLPSSLVWEGVSGSSYRVEFADDMDEAPWQFLTNQSAASNGLQVILAPASTNASRFYRLFRSP